MGSTTRIARRGARTVLAVVAASALALTACSSSPDAGGGDSDTESDAGAGSGAEEVKLTMTIVGAEADLTTMNERLAAAKEAMPNVEVSIVQSPDDYDTKVQTMFAGGTPPDIVQLGAQTHVYSSKGQLEDLTSAFPDARTIWSEGAVDTYSSDGKLWAAPDRVGSMVLYYNKDIFDDADVEYPNENWTWDDFREAALATTKRDGDVVERWGYGAGDWWAWTFSWLYQNGGRIINENGEPVLNSPENVEALEFYNAMVFDDKSALSPIDYANLGLDNGQPDPLFAQGKLAMNQTGFWNIGAMMDSDINWGISPVPFNKERAVAGFGDGLAVASTSKHKEEAIELVKFLTTTPEGQLPWIETALDVPAALAVLELDEATNPTWKEEDVDLTAFTNSVEVIFQPPSIPEWNEIDVAIRDGLAAVWMGDQPVKEGLDAVQAELERILS